MEEPIKTPAVHLCTYIKSSDLCNGRERAATAVAEVAAGSWGDAAHTLVTIPEYLGWLEEAASGNGLWIDESDTFVSADGDDEDPELTAQLNAMRESLMAIGGDESDLPYIDLEN